MHSFFANTSQKMSQLYDTATYLFGQPSKSGILGFIAGSAAGIATVAAIPATGAVATFAFPIAGAAYYVTKRVVQFGASRYLPNSDVAWEDISIARYPKDSTAALLNFSDLGSHMTCSWITSSAMKGIIQAATTNIALAWNWQTLVVVGAGNLVAEAISRSIRLKVLSHFTPSQTFGIVALGFGVTTLFSFVSTVATTDDGKIASDFFSSLPTIIGFGTAIFSALKESSQGPSTTKIECCTYCCATTVVVAPDSGYGRLGL